MATPSVNIDPALLQRVATGDAVAFRELFDAHWDRIYSIALAFTKSVVTSEELVQDIFLKIWLHRTELPGVRHFEGYLFMIARNHIYNTLRTKIKDVHFTDDLELHFAESTLADDLVHLKDAETLIRQAVDTLPTQQKAVFELSRYQGLSQEEIAQELQISRLTVKAHMRKALASLRTYLQQNADGLLLLSLLFRIQR